MAEKKPAKKGATTSAKRTSTRSDGFTAEERAAMKQRARELKAAKSREAGQEALDAAIAAMEEPDRVMAERVHAIVMAAAPDLAPRTWYGMPAYAKGDKVVCFFQDAQKFKSRYSTFGFSDEAALDDGGMWPTSYALKKMTAAEERQIRALVKRAVG
jgi:uncharacterized protein YdhG (YjbR/CyaY superfamily)